MRGSVFAAAIIAAVLGLVVVVVNRKIAHDRAENLRLVAECERQGPTESDFVRTAGAAAFTGPRSDELLRAYAAIRKGQSVEQIRQTLGPPTYVQAYGSKDGNGYTGCGWTYVMQARDSERGVEPTEFIQVLFGPDSQLRDSFHKKELE